MDPIAEQVQDQVLEGELVRNERVIEHPTFGRIRIRRPTPRKQVAIAEAYRRSQQADLFNDDIKSRAEVEAKAIARGMWSADMEDQQRELQVRFGALVRQLHEFGYESLPKVTKNFFTVGGTLIAKFAGEEFAEVHEAITRYTTLGIDPRASDRRAIQDAARDSSVDDLLDEIDTIRGQFELLEAMGEVRQGMNRIDEVQADLFANTIEGRARKAQNLAQIYHCIEDAETGKPLWTSEAAMMDEAHEVIAGLSTELYCYLNGITEEYRDMLVPHGFLLRVSATDGTSGGSHAHPLSSSDGEPQASEPSSFSESPAPTNSTTPSSS